MVQFVQTIYRLPNRTGYLLPSLQVVDETKALADFGKNGFDVLFVNMKGIAWIASYAKATCSVAIRSNNGFYRTVTATSLIHYVAN